jgi:hypothetical protein
MKTLRTTLILSALSISALSFSAHADDSNDACKPVFEACAAQGYAKDDTAPVGKKIWLNCANEILNKKKAVAHVDLDPNGFDAKNCRDYRKAKEKFDADWAANHKKPE